jgi:phosphoadenylyl-sulfate reductase (thioredoxin)
VTAAAPARFDAALVERLEAMPADEILRWAFETHGPRAAIVTSFQSTGTVTIDLASRLGLPFRVATVDTLRLHAETHEFIRLVERRYGLKIERFEPDADRVRKMIDQHGEYLFFDSKEKQEHCCSIRKVEPNERILETLDVWITGLRRDQSSFRAQNVRKAEVIDRAGRAILKVAPLADWSEADLRAYAKERGVPVHPLHDRGYVSIGCVICTTPVLPGEDPRAGRWRWQNAASPDEKKECGIHLAAPDGAGR